MDTIVTAQNLNPRCNDLKIKISLPRLCPRCNVAYDIDPISSYILESAGYNCPDSVAYSMYFCPHCGKCFLIEYQITHNDYDHSISTFATAVYPHSTSQKNFSEDLSILSPDFVKIYHQAESSENAGLTEICGLGYRKSLEFLVKDFAIHFYPDDSEKIKNQSLAQCINTYIENRHLKTLATASAWLGNDETHYVRKHENYNLEHLKAFISAVVSFVDSELAYLKAEQLLNDSK